MEISDRIRILRKEKGLTLEEVGNRVGVGKSTVRKWESGQIANMRRDKIALLASALGVSPAYLMGWPENDAPTDTPPSSPDPEMEEFIRRFLALSPENRRRILDLMRALAAPPVSPGDPPA